MISGKVERFNRTLATEWAYRRAYTSNDHRTRALISGRSTTTTDAHTPPAGPAPSQPPVTNVTAGYT